jgi:hypothetical protein
MIKAVQTLKALEAQHAVEIAAAKNAMIEELHALGAIPDGWEFVERGGYWCAIKGCSANVSYSSDGLVAREQYYEDVSYVPIAVVVAVLRANGAIP